MQFSLTLRIFIHIANKRNTIKLFKSSLAQNSRYLFRIVQFRISVVTNSICSKYKQYSEVASLVCVTASQHISHNLLKLRINNLLKSKV